MTEDERRRLELEAEAEAEAEFEYSQTKAPQAETPPQLAPSTPRDIGMLAKIGLPEGGPAPSIEQMQPNFNSAVDKVARGAGSLVGGAIGAPFGAAIPGAAAGNYVAGKALQAGDIEEPTTPMKDLTQAGTDLVLGYGAKYTAQALGGVAKKASGYLNEDETIARMFGANNQQMNPIENARPIQNNVKFLRENSPDFVENQIANGNVKDAALKAGVRLKSVGEQIGQVYENNKALAADVTDIQANPAYLKLMETASDPRVPPELANQAQKAIQQFEGPLASIAEANEGKLPLKDLWATRKYIDELINSFTKTNPEFYDEHLLNARTAIQDTINNTIKKLGPSADGQALTQLNAEYSNLHDVASALGRKYGQVAGRGLVHSNTPLSIKGATGNFAGLGTNQARALAFRAGQAADPLVGLIQSATPGMIAVESALLPRDTKQIFADTEKTNSVARLGMATGLIASPSDLINMPSYVADQLVTQLSVIAPQAFENTPDRVPVMNGKYLDPMAKDMVIDQHLDSDPETRAMIIGGSFQNKYIPPPAPTPKPVVAPPALPATMEQINKSLGQGLKTPRPTETDSSYDQSNLRMLEQLTNSEALHNGDYN